MGKPVSYLIFAIVLLIGAAAGQAQGISNARDGNGNLIDRGEATRSYPTTPMANSAVAPVTSQGNGNVVIARPRAVVIRARR
jgi:hypothetical protein